MRCSPKDDECRNPTNRWENVSFPLIPTSPCLTVEIFTGSSLHAGWDWEGPWGRGTPRNFPTTSVSDPENFQSFFLSLCVVVAPALFLWCSRIYIIRLEAFGKVVEERFEYLIVHTLSFFRWQRPWGSLRRPRAQTDKTSALQPSTWASRLEFFASGIPSQNH